MARTALYRHFDASDRLLYVGITDCLSIRDKQHAATAHWHENVARTETEWCVSREAAVFAEARAIATERPLHNRTWSSEFADKATVKMIVATVGSHAICETLDVSLHSVRFAINAGAFPASWFAGMLDLCIKHGVACPMHLFNWKRPAPEEVRGA